MDVSLVLQAAPTIGITGILLSLIGWLWRALNTAEKRHAAYVARINRDYDSDLDGLKEEIRELRVQVVALSKQIEDERELRRLAQEEAHELRMRGPR